MLNLEGFMIQRKFHFTVILKIEILKTKESKLFIKSNVVVAMAVT